MVEMFTTDGTTCFASLTYSPCSPSIGAIPALWLPAVGRSFFTRTGGSVSAIARLGRVACCASGAQLERLAPTRIVIKFFVSQLPERFSSIEKAPHKKLRGDSLSSTPGAGFFCLGE